MTERRRVNTITLEDGSTIATTGSQAHGVYLGQYSSLFVESGASISRTNRIRPWKSTPPPTRPSRWQGQLRSVAVGLFAADATNVAEGVNILVKDGGSIRTAGLTFTNWAWHLSWRLRQVGTRIRNVDRDRGRGVRRDQYGHERPDRECRQHKDDSVVESGWAPRRHSFNPATSPWQAPAPVPLRFRAASSNTITLTDSARILTKTSYSSGIVLGGSDVLSVASGATITTENNFSNGIECQ